MSIPDLHVNLADTDDIRRKLPEARQILEHLFAVLQNAQEDFENWTQLVRRLEVLAGEVDQGFLPTGLEEMTLQDMVVAIVHGEGRPMRPRDVVEQLERSGIEISSIGSINTALHSAARAGLLERPEKGYYAPPSNHPWPAPIIHGEVQP